MNRIKFNRLLKRYKYDRTAVAELYEYAYPLIVLYINRRFRGEIDGRDVAQQFFIRLFKNKATNVKNPIAWIYSVARDIAIEAWRKKHKQNEAEKKMLPPDTLYLYDGVSDILHCLEPTEQKIIYLRYWEKYKLKEIAELLQIKYESVKYYHRKAKSKLKKEKQKELLKCKST